jgi:Uma2 family endonuclease
LNQTQILDLPAAMPTTTVSTTGPPTVSQVPPLQAGDRLTRDEFERRYEATPHLKKAELIEGVVYMPPPVSADGHGAPHFDLTTILGVYRLHTPGVQGGDNCTIRLDLDNEPQPDDFLRILPECGGQSGDSGGYIDGAPELIAEVASSSVSYDLHDKMNAYRRNGVCEYVVWRVFDREIDWFVLREGRYERLTPDADGVHKSEVFPGLWLDVQALISGDLPRVRQVLEDGLATPEHAEFVEQLEEAKRGQST